MSPDRLSLTFSALADPTRRAILARLSAGEASVTELAEPFAMSLPAVSKHLKVLERAGLITRGREAQWRPCRLAAGPLKDASDWLEHYRQFWEESFDRLDDYLDELEARERELVITRIFDAPRNVVFQAWTEPGRAARWWGPQGFVTTYCDMDVRPGGAFRVCMCSPEGVDHWKQGVYREVVEPERLVFTFA